MEAATTRSGISASSEPASSRPAAAEGGPTPARDSAIRVLAMEAEALTALAAALDHTFDQAVDLLAAVCGRVIVTGMGKSGHVGRKIAATLASTGTPSFFVHPGEASHGDLGMLTRSDAVVALSNSGKTSELSDIIAYTRRHRIPLIGITRGAGSSLAERSDVPLVLPAAPEACPLGLAPTTSTTMMLALGDALAVALLERRGFTAGDFHQLHPGGQLGGALTMVGDIMHSGDAMPSCSPDSVLPEIIMEMTGKRLGCVGVVDGAGLLVGIITDGDLRRHLAPEMMGATAERLMSPSPRTIRPKALAAEALGLMNDSQITSLFVVEDGRPLGVVHIHDCLRIGAG